MVNFYVKMILGGAKKWTDVPSLWNERVKEALKADGFTLNEDGTISKEVEAEEETGTETEATA